ncbi:MFS transporter [Corynebacterium mendelii]|uniref:MFS transporter n=1 Tax=Corynebacterium mendelii TaxID=2765362 RepID=A0A939E3G3_9CORY|nr:MFS transporter [Corynebacterium mendelii]MBN9645063.1 MFS transporter [Corynebacterium mendelii]
MASTAFHRTTREYRTRWLFLAVLSAALFLIGLNNSVLLTALPTIRATLPATGGQSLWIINSYSLVLAGMLIGAGSLGDRIGHRRLFALGLAVFAVGCTISTVAPGPAVLITGRAVLGLGAACLMPATLALLKVTFTDHRELSRAVGIWNAVFLASVALGPIIGGALLEYLDWHLLFAAQLPLIALVALALKAVGPANVAQPGRRFSVVNSVLLMVAVGSLVLAFEAVAHTTTGAGGTSPTAAWMTAAGAVAATAGAVMLLKRRQRHPATRIADPAALRHPVLLAGLATALLTMIIPGGLEFVTTQRFQLVGGFTALQAGLVTTAVAVSAIPGTLIGGQVMPRFGVRAVVTAGLTVTTAGIVVSATAFSDGDVHMTAFVTGLMIAGLGLGTAQASSNAAVITTVPKHSAGTVGSLEEVAYEVGFLLAITTFGTLMEVGYRLGAPDGHATDVIGALNHADGAVSQAAGHAYDAAAQWVLFIAAATAAVLAVVLNRLFPPLRATMAPNRTKPTGSNRTTERDS